MKHNNIDKLKRSNRKFSDDEGFILPQILILSIGLALGITALLNSAINKLSSNRIATLEIQAKNSAESGISTVKGLLNNSKEGFLYYYWLAKTCSLDANKSKDCYNPGSGVNPRNWPGIPVQGFFPNLSSMYWADAGGKWCDGVPNCYGRQVAPKCTYAGKTDAGAVSWHSYSSGLSKLLDRNKDKVGFDIPSATATHEQSFSLKATDYVGDEQTGTTGLLIEGYAHPKNSPNIDNATNKLRVDISITKVVTPQAFAVISAGETERDNSINNSTSLYLGNFAVKGDKTGSIIWRKSIYTGADCSNIKSFIGARQAILPDNTKGDGGLFVQPLFLPERPKITAPNVNMGSIFCYGGNSQNVQSDCDLGARSIKTFPSKERIVTVDDIFVSGKNAKLDIVTSDKSRVKLIVRGSIHIANEGVICHRDKIASAKCGTGKVENLTILFDQPGQNALPIVGNINAKQELACSPRGGLMLRENKRVPYNSFIISSTGKSNTEKFSGFIYAPKTTFSTTRSYSKYFQNPKTGLKNHVVARGLHAFINNPDGNSSEKSPIYFRSPNGKLIPFQNDHNSFWDNSLRNEEIIAVGQKILPTPVSFYNHVVLTYNKLNRNYFLRGFDIKSNGSLTEGHIVNNSTVGGYQPLGLNPLQVIPNANTWLSYYGIELLENNQNPIKNFRTIAWMKNICLDNNGFVHWDFDKDFNKQIVERFAKIEFNYGVPYYRGQSVKVWDTLRSFN